MAELAAEQPGFLGMESVRDGRTGITLSYWRSEEAIAMWKENAEHLDAQRGGRFRWYERYHVRIARVEREYGHGPPIH